MANQPRPPAPQLLGALAAVLIAYGSIKLDAHLELQPNDPKADQSVVQRNAG